MNYERILIRYGEISTKGRNRKGFLDKLRKNIKLMLRDFEAVEVEYNRDRMFVHLNGEDATKVMEILKGIFGIQSFSPVVKSDANLETMKETVLKIFKKQYQEGQTFKITTKRSDKTFPLDTFETNHALGSHLLMNIEGLKVDVKNPDINILVEIRADGVYFSSETIKGAGGLPIGTGGRAHLMLSGGIDSPVAGYLAMKRGVEVEAVHFYSPPFTSERSKEKVIDLTRELAKVSGRVKLHIVPFTKVQQLIVQQIPENYLMTTTRRLMLKITDEVRRRNEGLAIINGENLGQVASQTLESMYAINDVTSTPILRPLITMDKNEIIKIAQEINTFDISNRPFEDCCTVFVPANPKTKPKKDKVEHFESFVDFEELIREAVLNTETIVVKGLEKQVDKEIEDLF